MEKTKLFAEQPWDRRLIRRETDAEEPSIAMVSNGESGSFAQGSAFAPFLVGGRTMSRDLNERDL